MKKKPIDPSGFNAIGKPIPSHRLTKSTQEAMSIVGKAASYLEHDNPYGLIGAVSSLNDDLDRIDLTGRYRLMATS